MTSVPLTPAAVALESRARKMTQIATPSPFISHLVSLALSPLASLVTVSKTADFQKMSAFLKMNDFQRGGLQYSGRVCTLRSRLLWLLLLALGD